MRIDRTHLGHYGAQQHRGVGFDLWPHDSGQGVFLLAFFPGPVWLEGGEATYNPLTRATDLALGWRGPDGAMHRCGNVRLTAGPDSAINAAFNINGGPPGLASFSDTFARLVGNGSVAPPPFPPPPEPPEPIVPIEPGQPVLPPGLVGRLNPIVRTWLQLFGSEFGGSGWRLQPPWRLTNGPDGSCAVLSIAFRAPSIASGFDHGRFTQNPDGGQLLKWLSREPADLSMAHADPRAWQFGLNLAWSLAGAPGHPTQDRVRLAPGEIYYLNGAFVSPALITDGRVEPIGAGGEYALTATQQS